MPVDPRRVKELFNAAVDLADSQARQALLDRECGNDVELRQRLEVLLEAHDRPMAALDKPLAAIPTPATQQTAAFAPAENLIGSVIGGKYKLLQAIGEGGMGSVFMADQLEPVKRRVALKLIRTNLDSSHVLARFEAERQALALMDHPHIAKVLDAGSTETNRPFFVMELVKGIPLTQYCDEHRLAMPDRLHLFMQVCSAVQHAHQKGIIHRDLKPTNILVESHDGKPVPKVIDFGLAKATSGMHLTEHTLFTALGSVAGTPLYMAPEQAAFNAIDVDTRADIYTLGVILYELLTGSTPIEREQLKKAAFDEVLRVIRESEPPVPSKRLSASASKPSVAANRQMEPAKLGRFLRGDLDWVVMKALSKERDRRYETANGFAKDIERFLSQEPVVAGPPTTAYRLRKFVRRNRAAVLTAALIAAMLLVGTTVATWQAVVIAKSRAEMKQIVDRIHAEIAHLNEDVELYNRRLENAKLRVDEARAPLNEAESSVARLEARRPSANPTEEAQREMHLQEARARLAMAQAEETLLEAQLSQIRKDLEFCQQRLSQMERLLHGTGTENNYADAVKDWNRAIELAEAREQRRYRVRQANERLKLGQVSEAIAEVAELTKIDAWTGRQWYDFACIYAVASAKTAGKKQEYADRAMDLLKKSIQAGYKDAAHMQKDKDLDALRDREDFKKLLAELGQN